MSRALYLCERVAVMDAAGGPARSCTERGHCERCGRPVYVDPRSRGLADMLSSVDEHAETVCGTCWRAP